MTLTVPELFSLAGKTAVITGATRSIGAALAIALAEAGADIISVQRSASNTATQKAIQALGRTCTIYTCDLSSRDDLTSLIPTITASHKIDILVNCAGIVIRSPVIDHTIDDYDAVFQTNVTASWLLCQSVARYWLSNGLRGKIVNVSSILGRLGAVDQAPYAMSKGAIELMTKSMSNEWAAKGINVNIIAPGYTATDMNEDIIQSGDPEFRKSANGRIPAERWGTPEDYKGAVVFLTSKASDWIHGETLVIDGGHLGK